MPPLLELKNIGYKTPDKTILPTLSLTVEQGQHLLLLGPSGCGKTTLLNIAAALLKPSNGDILFKGTAYGNLTDSALTRLRAENFGFVFQRLHLIGHLDVAQNIALSRPRTAPDKTGNILDDLGLTGMERRKTRDLSAGEAQRVCIARALANNPAIIFADEPTSALDDSGTEKVMDLLFGQAAKTGATIIAATHDARIKSRFGRVLEMPL